MNRSILRIDWALLIPALVLVILGISGIFSLSFSLFKSQVIFLFISIFFYIFFSQVNTPSIRNYTMPIYIFSLILLLIVLVVGIESRGSVRWLEFFGFRIQFAEILKPFLLVSLASFLSKKEKYSFKSFALILLLAFPIFVLIFLQPDLGNALIYLITVVLVLFTFGFPLRYFSGLFLLGVLLLPIFWKFLKEYQRERIFTFLKLKADPLGLSYNAIQSVIAVGSGMLFGKGFGQGTQSVLRFLPERHTDFIFATLSEELGFFGSAVVILAFLFILYRIFVIFRETTDSFSKVFAISAFFVLGVQFFVNIGMNIGIVPVVGVSLPFVSYGGSSLLSSFILLGFLSSMSKGISKKETLEIR